MEEINIDAADVATAALSIKGILTTIANFTAALKFLSIALMIFAVILAIYIAKKLLKEIYTHIILEIFSILKQIYNVIRGKIFGR